MTIQIPYIEEVKRKLVHLSSLWMVLATLLITAQWMRCLLFGTLLLLTVFSEHSYANQGLYLGRLYGAIFGRMLRQKVHPGQWIVSGGAPVLASALLVNLVFDPAIAAMALTILLVGDAAAALIGRKFGSRHIINDKSLEGTLAFIAFGYVASACLVIASDIQIQFLAFLIPATILGALVELFQKQLRLDDNLLIPLFSGLILQVFAILSMH